MDYLGNQLYKTGKRLLTTDPCLIFVLTKLSNLQKYEKIKFCEDFMIRLTKRTETQ